MEIIEINGTKLFKFNVGPSSYLLNPTEGARLINWNVSMADGCVRDVIYWPEDAPLAGAELPQVLGGMFIMFPFCGNSFVDGEAGWWIAPDGQKRPMQKHGYVNGGNFEILYSSDTDVKLRYIPSDSSREAYPYDYTFDVFYRFNDLSFSCELILSNNGDEKIPWGAGLHPFFNMPWSSGTTRKDYRLVCDAKKGFYINADGSYSPADLSKNCFADAEMWNRLHTSMKTGVVKFGVKNGEEDVTIRINGGGKPDGAMTLVTWSRTDESPYYCVEPWLSMPNSASKPAHFVAPKSSKSFSIDFDLV